MSNKIFNKNENGIVLYYFNITEIFNNETIQSLISTFSVFEQQYFNSIQNKDAQKRTLFGRIILKYISARLGISRSDFVSLTSWGKPVFTLQNGYDFNISHSGNMVVCCLSKDSFVGIDLELNRPLKIEIYKNYFDSQEWQFIKKSETPESAFFKLWVRKEAVIKADGRGIGIELSSFNCLNKKADVGPSTYFIQDIYINHEYTCAIACSKKKTIKLKDFNEIFLTEYIIGFNTHSIHQANGKV